MRRGYPTRRPRRVRGQRAVPVRPAARRAGPPWHPQGHPGVEHLQAGRAGAALVVRRHPDERSWPATTTSASRPPTTTATRPSPCSPRGKPSLHGALLAAKAAGHTHVLLDGTLIRDRPDLHPGPDPRGGPVVVGQAPPPRRQHPGRLRPRRLAAVDLRRAPGPRARHHRRPRRPRPARPDPPPGSTTASSAWPTWATKAKPTCCASRSRNPPAAS